MPTKRAILAELTRDELRTNVDYYALEVEDRRVKTQLVDALSRSRQAPLDEILQDLSRDRLKELCRAFDLDDSGRKKADLAARLMGRTVASKDADAGAVMPPAVSASVTDKLSVAQLEQSLWSAADILRGSIDSSDYKTYIFGLLFLKRLSDRFEEEAEKLIAEGVAAQVAWTDPDEHQFFVPNRARWDAIQKRATNIGETLNKACAALEEQNSALEGVLAGIDYNDERKLGDARNRDTVLARLVQHFSQVSLRNGKTPYVRFDRNAYSIPHTHVRKPLTLLASATRVRILDRQTEIARHRRSYDTGQTLEDPQHLEGLLAATRQSNPHTTRDRLRVAVPATATLFERLAERGEPLRAHATRLLALLDDYGPQELAAAVAVALERDALGAGSITHILETRRRQRGHKPPLRLTLPNRPGLQDIDVRPHDLETYDALSQHHPDDAGD